MDDEAVPFSFNVFTLAFKEPGAIRYFAENLPPDAVGIPEGHTGIQQLYGALLDYHIKTGTDTVDPIAFKTWLHDETEIHAALGGGGGVSVLIDTVLELEPPSKESLVGILKYRDSKRKQLSSLQELQLLVTKKEQKSDSDLGRVHYLTEQIRSLEKDIGYNPFERVVTATEIAKKTEGLWDLPDFMPTQFKSLNKAMGYTEDGGFCKGAVHAILAQSGRGKSSLAKSLMNYWCDVGHKVLYVNYEEAIAHWERVLFTQVTGQNVYKAAVLSREEKQHYTDIFTDKMAEWGDRFMVRHDPDTPYFEDLERWLRDLIGHNDRIPDAIIIDTIQSMFLKGGGGKQRWGQYEEMMVRLEKLAKDLHTVIIITAQENTNRMKERREVVEQSDTGGSISIVQKSAITIFITPQKLLSADDAEDDHVMQLQIPKNRITGNAFTLEPPMVRYVDACKLYLPHDPVDRSDYDGGFVLDEVLERDFT